jgi:hypothetical protein
MNDRIGKAVLGSNLTRKPKKRANVAPQKPKKSEAEELEERTPFWPMLWPPDEDDPETQEEMFDLYQGLGGTPEDLENEDEETQKAYAEWLKRKPAE